MLSARLAANGFIVGRDVNIEVASVELELAKIPELVREMVSRNPDVIYTTHEFWVDALKLATSTIPVVFSSVTEPVERGYVHSFSRSGTNIVGIADRAREMMVKRVELLREAFPRARRLMVLGAFTNLVNADIAALNDAANRVKFEVINADISARSVEQTLADADLRKPNAILPFGGLDVRPGEHGVKTLFAYVARRRIPVLFSNSKVAEAGGLMSLTIDTRYTVLRSAELVVKILKGAQPSTMPVEQADRFELVINLKTARKLGLTIPQSVLVRADRVID
jgi:putative ABC transport system substrate-binding protein